MVKNQATVEERVLAYISEYGKELHSLTLTAIAASLDTEVEELASILKKLVNKRAIEEQTIDILGEKRKIYILTETGVSKAKALLTKIGERKVYLKDLNKEVKISAVNKELEKLKLLAPGSYLIKDKKPDKAFELYKAQKKPGLCITATYPDKIRERYEIKDEIYWLSESKGAYILHPRRLKFELIKTIIDFVKVKKSVVVIDGIEYLVLENGFDKVAEFIKAASDIISRYNSVLIIPINPASFSAKELSILESETEALPERVHLPIKTLTHSQILSHSPHNVFDWRKAILKELEKGFVDFLDRAPRLRYFFGRKKEIETIKEWLDANKKIIAIYGIAGIGKTTLALKAIESYKQKKHIFWYRCHEWDSPRNVLTSISELLSKTGLETLEAYLRSKETIDLSEVSMILEKELKEINALMVFDDLHYVKQDIIQLFSLIKEIIEGAKNATLIVIGRTLPTFYSRADVSIKRMVMELQVRGLDRESSKELLNARDIVVEDEKFENVYKAIGGHPLALELIDPATLEKPLGKDLRRYLKEEIALKLSEDEKTLLGLASVFRYPVEESVITTYVDSETLDKLTEKALIQQFSETYGAHTFIKDFFYDRLTPPQREQYHGYAADYYKTKKDERSGIEAIYHFLKANKQINAVRLVIERGRDLINKGYLKEFELILKDFRMERVSAEEWIEVLMFKGDVLDITGEWSEALECYAECLKMAEKLGKQLKVAEAHRKIGHIHVKNDEWKSAIENYEKSLEISEKINDLAGLANAYWGIGRVCWRKGELDKSTESLNKCIKFSQEINDVPQLAKGYIDLGNAYSVRGEYDNAIQSHTKALKIFEELDNKYELARVYNNLGVCYSEGKKDYDKAIEYSEKQIEVAEEIGHIRVLGYGLSNAAEYLANKLELEKAENYCNRAMTIFEKLGERRMVSAGHRNRAAIHMHRKEWGKATAEFEKSRKIVEEMNDPGGMSQLYHEYGKMYREKGEPEKATELFKKAEKIYEKLGNKEKVEELKKELESVKK